MDNLNNDLRSEVEYTENKKGNIGMEIFIERYKLFVNNYKIAGKVQCLERWIKKNWTNNIEETMVFFKVYFNNLNKT